MFNFGSTLRIIYLLAYLFIYSFISLLIYLFIYLFYYDSNMYSKASEYL